MPLFNEHGVRRFISRRGQTVTVRNTRITHDPASDWDDETYTVEAEIQTKAILTRPGAQPQAIRDVEGVELNADYMVYLRDDIELSIYDSTAEDYAATEVDVGGGTFAVIAAPVETGNGSYELPVERVDF